MGSAIRHPLRVMLATFAALVLVSAVITAPALARLGPHIIVHEGGANLHSSPGGPVIMLLPQYEHFYVDASHEGVWCYGYGESPYWEENDVSPVGWLLCGELDA